VLLPSSHPGWKSVGVLELSVLPSLDEELWTSAVREADVLLVNGGDPLFLHHWVRESGLTALLPELDDTAWVGLSAGSMIMTPRIGEDFVGWRPPTGGDDSTLGLVDFSIFPHLDHPDLPENHMGAAEKWAGELPGPSYALDDDSAIKVVGDTVEVVSEGTWRHFS
jgi:dipeptidase E